MRSAALQRTGVLAGVAATLLAMVSVQSGAAIAITLFASVGPVAVVALRLVTASAFLVSTARPPSAALRTPMVATLAGYGLVIAGMNCCFYLAIKRVPLGVAVALEMVGTIVVAIIGSRRPRDLAAAAPGGAQRAGAGADARGRRAGHRSRRRPGARRRRMLGRVHPALGAPRAAAAGRAGPRAGDDHRRRPGHAARPRRLGADLLSPRVLAIGAAVGLLSTALPGTLDAIALRRLRSVTYALVLSLSPAVAALSGFAIRDQQLSLAQWVGVVLVMVASAAAVTGAEPPDAAANTAL